MTVSEKVGKSLSLTPALSTPEARRAFGQLLGEKANYLKIRSDSKAPVGSFLKGKRNRYKRIPKEGNYGIIPQGGLVILDVDVHKGGSVDEQLCAFSELLCMDLTKTLTIMSPSGGLHVYLELPDAADSFRLPKTTLRSFSREIQETLGREFVVDADIRSEAANAYVVGPGSKLEGTYKIHRNLPIAKIPAEGLARITALPTAKETNRPKMVVNDQVVAVPPLEDEIPTIHGPKDSAIPSNLILERLHRALQKRKYRTFHQQRAFVKAALHCCYSNEAIARACIALNVNKDSHSGGTISRAALQTDLNKFNPTQSFHGSYCPVGLERKKKKTAAAYGAYDWEEHLKKVQAKNAARSALAVEDMFLRPNPRVLNLRLISDTLLRSTKRGVKAKQYVAAMMIVEGFLQPLTNAGAEKILLAQVTLQEELGLTASQVSQGLRLLRSLRVVELRNRQKQGVAPTYVVHSQFIHKKLTFHLRRTWVEQKHYGDERKLIYSPREGGFRTALGGEPVFTNSLAAAIAVEDRALLEAYRPLPVSTTVLSRYLRSEK